METPDTEIIKENVFDQLKWDSSVNAENININVSDGTVWLDGIVNGYIPKKEAINMATYTTGVKNVIDDILIKM